MITAKFSPQKPLFAELDSLPSLNSWQASASSNKEYHIASSIESSPSEEDENPERLPSSFDFEQDNSTDRAVIRGRERFSWLYGILVGSILTLIINSARDVRSLEDLKQKLRGETLSSMEPM
jgi:hypothetical protein